MNALRFSALALIVPACGPALMPTPNLYIDRADQPFADVDPALRSNRVELFYATDRRPDYAADGTVGYSHERDYRLSYGTCTVQLGPDDLSWEELVAASTRKRRGRIAVRVADIAEHGRLLNALLPIVEDQGRPVLDPRAVAEQAEREAAMSAHLSARLRRAGRPEVFLFIHGFANAFEDAATRSAELWHFLGRVGVPVIYSWPAGGSSYVYDRESGQFTHYHLKRFLLALGRCPELHRVHIVAHSRGTEIIMAAITELYLELDAAGRDPRDLLKLGRMVLAAPDLDLDVAQMRYFGDILQWPAERLTFYVSRSDLAIGMAQLFFDSRRRIGSTGVDQLTTEELAYLELSDNIEIVNCDVPSDFIGHAYFRSSPAVSSDLIRVLRDGAVAGSAERPLKQLSSHFWDIEPGYLRK